MAKLNGVKTLDMQNGEVTKVEYNGEVYAKVDGRAQVGDIGLRVDDEASWANIGAFYPIIRGSAYLDNDDFETFIEPTQWTFFRKVNTTAEPAQTYALVTDREPKAGDFVKFSRNYTDVDAGKYYEIYEDDDLVIEDDAGDKRWALLNNNRNAKFYEKVAKPETLTHNGATYALVDRKAQPGDVVVFANDDNPEWLIKAGKPYLVEVIGGEGAEFYGEDGDSYNVYSSCYDRTPANVKVYAPVATKEESLKVGDYAKALKASKYGNHTEGTIVVIESVNFHGQLVARGIAKGASNGIWQYGELVRATDEEVAAVKAEDERKAIEVKWAAIGRKPNEFKKGDIAKLVISDGSIYFGEITEVQTGDTVRFKHLHAIKYRTTTESIKKLTLITPVEQRFDLAEGQTA